MQHTNWICGLLEGCKDTSERSTDLHKGCGKTELANTLLLRVCDDLRNSRADRERDADGLRSHCILVAD
jgi:hypothetical protein